MDQSTMVGDQVADGRRFVERFAADSNLVTAAFWLRAGEEGRWYLYIATEVYDTGGPAAAYGAVHASLNKLDNIELDSSEIKVVSPDNSIAREVLSLTARYPSRSGKRYGLTLLGSLLADELYIYPTRIFTFTQAIPMTKEDIGREVLRLMDREPGILQSSPVTLQDGTKFNGLPFSFQLADQSGILVSFIDDSVMTPRVVRLSDIASIG